MRRDFGPGGDSTARTALARACLRPALVAAIAAAQPAFATETAILSSPNVMPGAEMAYSAGLDGTTVVVGAPGENATAGGAYAIDCTVSPCATPVRIAPDDIGANDAFGTAVSISGDTLAATAPGPEPGAVYVYVRNAGVWTQQARLTPSGGSSGERFGVSASLSGDRLAVGADRAGNSAGAVYVFARSGTAWVQEARLTAADPASRDALGSSVSLDADTLVAGAPFKRGATTDSYANGAAYVFVRNGGVWSQQAKLVPATIANGDLFGFSADVSGDRAVFGAPYTASARGTAYVFTRTGSTWAQQTQLDAPSGAAGDEFGWSVALGSTAVLVGAPFAGQLAGAACGRSYVFDGPALVESGAGAISTPVLNEMNGWAIAASGARWVSSAPGHVIGIDDHAGAAYWFDEAFLIFRSGFDPSPECIAVEGGA